MKKLTALIIERPVQVLLFTVIILVALALGITRITLKTGNDTLISSSSDIYKDNEAYQMEFGKDPIILIFKEETQFDAPTLELMNKLQTDIKDLDGIFSINSPVTVINQIGKKMYTETEAGLGTMAEGLTNMSDMLETLGLQLAANDGSDLPDMSGLATNMQQLIFSQNQLETGLFNMFNVFNLMQITMQGLNEDLDTLKTQVESDPLLVDELQLINNIIEDTSDLDANLAQLALQEGLKAIPTQTALALQNILTSLSGLSTTLSEQLEAIETLSLALLGLSENLGNLATNLSQIKNNFNVFKPGFPTSAETIEIMIYDQGVLRNNFKGFVVSQTQIRMVVVLNGNVTGEEVDAISKTLNNRLELEESNIEVLISGKPILDCSIKSSMMESMKYMMLSAIAIMVLILIFIYRVKMKLLPIFMILIAVVVTIGIMGWSSIGLTMVSMAVFPVLIGLGIDYFIQFQTRYEEERSKL